MYLADIVRNDRHLGPVSPDERLEDGDLLIFVGDVTDVLDLRARAGLRPPREQAEVLDDAREPLYFEAVIGRESDLVGRTLKEVWRGVGQPDEGNTWSYLSAHLPEIYSVEIAAT